jgi:CheY-like chemotaxis protein
MVTAPATTTPILVIEDNAFTRNIMTTVLECEGYPVVAAADGREALEQMRDGQPPALILLDLMMPTMNGWEFRQLQRQEPRLEAVPVVVVSAVADLEHNAASVEAAAYLQKPYEIDTLLDLVRRLLEKP